MGKTKRVLPIFASIKFLAKHVFLFQAQLPDGGILYTETDMTKDINYSMLALMVLGPTLLLLTRINWREAKWVGYALASFLVAITFRIVDPLRLIPTGTHFLWHIFGAAATSCMFIFIYRTDTLSARPVSSASPQSP